MQCTRCALAPPGLVCPLVRCAGCFSRQLPREDVARVRGLLAGRVRASTRVGHVRGLRDFLGYARAVGCEAPLPASSELVQGYIAYSLVERPFVLDAGTVDSYLGGVRAWHEQAKEETQGHGPGVLNPCRTPAVRAAMKVALKDYKKDSEAMRPLDLDEWSGLMERGFDDSRSGRHGRLAVVLAAVGPFRPVAAKQLTIIYTVGARGDIVYDPRSVVRVVRPERGRPYIHIVVRGLMDKNVSSNRVRHVPIPDEVLGVQPVALLEDWLRRERPPSGGYLLVAPSGVRGFYSTQYTALGKAVQRAYARAFPGASLEGVGGASPRKSLPQWLHEAGHSVEEISDVGGWALRRHLGAVHTYFKTTLQQQLAIKRALHQRLLAVAVQ